MLNFHITTLSDEQIKEYICKLRAGELPVRKASKLNKVLKARHKNGEIQTRLEEIAVAAFTGRTQVTDIQAYLLANTPRKLCS